MNSGQSGIAEIVPHGARWLLRFTGCTEEDGFLFDTLEEAQRVGAWFRAAALVCGAADMPRAMERTDEAA